MNKTNVARLLDIHKINYRMVEYQVDETDLSAVHVAAQLGQEVERVFKTLVLRGDKTGIFVAVVPGDAEVNLKKTAKVSGNKSAAMVHMKELLGLTGYIRGGCSPIGMKKTYPTFIDESCELFDTIFISAGQRGIQIEINPGDLILFIKAETCSLID
jgi:Cys-tRNA(Pro)/Cys-tRNA(Cys) deacylase